MIYISPSQDQDIRHIGIVLRGVGHPPHIKRTLLVVDLYPGAFSYKDIGAKGTLWRELYDTPKLMTVKQVTRALYLLKQTQKDPTDQRYDFYVNYGPKGKNLTGKPRFHIKGYGEVIPSDDYRMAAFIAGDRAIGAVGESVLTQRGAFCKDMEESATDPVQKLKYQAQYHRLMLTIAESKLAQRSYA